MSIVVSRLGEIGGYRYPAHAVRSRARVARLTHGCIRAVAPGLEAALRSARLGFEKRELCSVARAATFIRPGRAESRWGAGFGGVGVAPAVASKRKHGLRSPSPSVMLRPAEVRSSRSRARGLAVVWHGHLAVARFCELPVSNYALNRTR